eukprot:487378-Amphidinium_carterae.1
MPDVYADDALANNDIPWILSGEYIGKIRGDAPSTSRQSNADAGDRGEVTHTHTHFNPRKLIDVVLYRMEAESQKIVVIDMIAFVSSCSHVAHMIFSGQCFCSQLAEDKAVGKSTLSSAYAPGALAE